MQQNIDHIFRTYDIRGIYGQDLNEEIMENIGTAFAYVINNDIIVSRDVRLSSESLKEAFVRGFTKSGFNVEDVGMLPLGTAGFYTWKSKKPLAYITASHLEKEWNGVKFFDEKGIGLFEETMEKIKEMFDRITEKSIKVVDQNGSTVARESKEITVDYISHFLNKIKPVKRMKIIIDCSNGAASTLAPTLFSEAGFEVIAVNSEPDGNFPNRSPPDPPNDDLKTLSEKVISEKAEFGIAYDGDGDRMVFVDDSGRKISAEQISYFIVSELLKSVDGPIIENVECTKLLDSLVDIFGQKIIRVPVGHTYLMKAVHENNAAFGFEVTGHFSIPSLISIDDSLGISYYTACLLSGQDDRLSKIMSQVPVFPFGRVNMECDDRKKFEVIRNLQQRFAREYENINVMDGVRVDFAKGWILIRAANTEPKIRLTIEAENEKEFNILKDKFSKILEDEIQANPMSK